LQIGRRLSLPALRRLLQTVLLRKKRLSRLLCQKIGRDPVTPISLHQTVRLPESSSSWPLSTIFRRPPHWDQKAFSID
jgi:hypothetical protein